MVSWVHFRGHDFRHTADFSSLWFKKTRKQDRIQKKYGGVCVCVCVTGHRSMEYSRIMRWWSSNLGHWPLQNLGLVAYCYIAILDPHRPLLPPSTAQTPPPPTSILSPHIIICPPRYHPYPSQHTNNNVPLPHPSLSVPYPSTPPSPLPHLPNSCCRLSLVSTKIYYNMTLSCLSSDTCLHHGTRRSPPPS